MSEPDLIGLFIEPLEALGTPYMVTGGVASVIYGDPRFTRDVDIVLELHPPDIERMRSAFGTGEFYVPPIETLARETARPEGGHFKLIHRDTALRADVYLRGADPLHAWAFARRRRITVRDMTISIAPIAYVVVRKLQYFRASGSERHIRDVAMMLRISADQLDADALEPWIEELDLRTQLDAARRYGA